MSPNSNLKVYSYVIELLKGVVSLDYIYMHIKYAPKLNIIYIVKSLIGNIENYNNNMLH